MEEETLITVRVEDLQSMKEDAPLIMKGGGKHLIVEIEGAQHRVMVDGFPTLRTLIETTMLPQVYKQELRVLALTI